MQPDDTRRQQSGMPLSSRSSDQVAKAPTLQSGAKTRSPAPTRRTSMWSKGSGTSKAVTVTFVDEGALGVKFQENKKTGRAAVTGITPGSQAEQFAQLRPGMVLESIGELPVAGTPFKTVIKEVKGASRPLTMTFISSAISASATATASKWFYETSPGVRSDSGVDKRTIVEAIDQGLITADTRLWTQGMSKWKCASSLQGHFDDQQIAMEWQKSAIDGVIEPKSQIYRCAIRIVMRGECSTQAPVTGVCEVGDQIVAIEAYTTVSGAELIKCKKGWVSTMNSSGKQSLLPHPNPPSSLACEDGESTQTIAQCNVKAGEPSCDKELPPAPLERSVITLRKGSSGYGMRLMDSGHVVSLEDGSPAALAQVPCPSRIVQVNGQSVRTKFDVAKALHTQVDPSSPTEFVFAVAQFAGESSNVLQAKIVSLQQETERLSAGWNDALAASRKFIAENVRVIERCQKAEAALADKTQQLLASEKHVEKIASTVQELRQQKSTALNRCQQAEAQLADLDGNLQAALAREAAADDRVAVATQAENKMRAERDDLASAQLKLASEIKHLRASAGVQTPPVDNVSDAKAIAELEAQVAELQSSLQESQEAEASAKSSVASLEQSLDEAVKLCKLAEGTWNMRHEAHIREMELLHLEVSRLAAQQDINIARSRADDSQQLSSSSFTSSRGYMSGQSWGSGAPPTSPTTSVASDQVGPVVHRVVGSRGAGVRIAM